MNITRGRTAATLSRDELLALAALVLRQIPEAAGQRFFFFVALWNRVSMRFLHHLNFMLDLAQKPISLGQLVHLLG